MELKTVIFVCYYFTSNVQSRKTTITNILRFNILSFQKRASVFLAFRNYLFFCYQKLFAKQQSFERHSVNTMVAVTP